MSCRSSALLLSVLGSSFLVACASSRTLDVVHEPAPLSATAVTDAPRATELPAPAVAPVVEPLALAIEPAPAAPAAEGLHESRFTVKGGYYGFSEDELDDGWIFNVAWMRYFTKVFAIELEAGYIDGDGEEDDVDAEVWATPIMLNGRFNVPLWILDLYAGAGIGTFYYDAEVGSFDDDGFIWGANGFIGGTINVADRVALGLEAKYYLTDDIVDEVDSALDAYAIMLTLGWGR